MRLATKFLTLTIASCCALFVSDANAQRNAGGGGTSSSGFSSGSGFGGSGGFGGGGFGQGGVGGGGFGSGGGFGQGGFGQGGFGGQPGAFSTGAGQGGEGSVGRDATDIQQFFERLNQARGEAGQQQRTTGSRNRGQGANAGEDAPPPIRVKITLGFTPPATPPAMTQTAVARLDQIIASRGFGAAEVTIDSGVAVLTGVVDDASQRRVLEQLVKLEPVVKRVRNELVVATPLEEFGAEAIDGPSLLGPLPPPPAQ